jgi:hypothetical protein
MNSHIRDQFNAIGGAWTAYTPAFTGSVSNPTAASHTIVGSWLSVGKLVFFRAQVSLGSANYGSGNYSLSLPTAVASTYFTLLTGNLYDSSAGGLYRGGGIVSSGSSTALLVVDPTTAGNALRTVTPTVPFTFAVNDQIHIHGVYEAA